MTITTPPFYRSALLLSITLILSLSSAAQSVALDSVMIVADRLPAARSQLTTSVTTIDSETIRQMPINSVDELLRGLAGVNINSRGAFGVQADIGIRGTTFAQILVLVDGRRINDPLTGHFNNNIPIPLHEIDRVEVVRGAGSTAYGADAVGGVIHIHTKAFSANRKNGISSSGEAGYGQYGLRQYDAGLSIGSEKSYLSLGVKLNDALGEEFVNPNTDPLASMVELKSSDFSLQTYTLAAATQISEQWSLAARGTYLTNDFDAQYFYTTSSFDESRETVSSGSGHLRLARSGSKSETSIDASVMSTDDLFAFNPALTPNSHRSRRFLLNADQLQRLKDGTQLSYGIAASRRDIVSTDRGDHEDDNLAAYLLASRLLGDHLRAMAGMRLEYDTNFGTEFVPEIGLSYFTKELTLRAEIADAVRAADFTERFVSDQIPQLSAGRNLGNPDLAAERFRTYSLGAEYRAGSSNLFSADGFFRQGSDMIDFVNTLGANIQGVGDPIDTASYRHAQNLSAVETVGFELTHTFSKSYGERSSLRSDVGYTWLETTTPEGEEVSTYLALHPSHQLDWRLEARFGRFGLQGQASYFVRDAEEIESLGARIPAEYALLHLAATARLSEEISLYAKVHNVLDEQYQEILGARMPGRWVMGGLRWDID